MWIFIRRAAGVVAALALVPLWPASSAAADPSAGPSGRSTAGPSGGPGVDAVRAAVAKATRAAGLNSRAAGPTSRPPAAESGTGAGLTAVGGGHTCALVQYADLWCWGAGAQGQLGTGTTRDSAAPVRVTATGPLAGAAGLLGVQAGRVHTCALALEYAAMGLVVYCWGGNDEGQLGDGSFADRSRPAQVAADAVQVVTGAEHTCVLDVELTVSCWGRNDAGQLGRGTLGTSESNPEQVPGLTGIIDLAAGDDTTCALGQTGKLWCWGSDADGQLGDGAGPGDPAPGPVAVRGGPYTEVSAGRRHVCALGAGSVAYCWGAGDRGQLGRAGDRSVPGRVGGRVYAGVRAGGDSTCGITPGGGAYCWGANDNGQLGVGGSTDRAVPTAVNRTRIHTSTPARLVLGRPAPLLTDLSAGAARSCATDASLVVYCTRGGVLSAVPLAPGMVTGVRAAPRPGGLRVSWVAPGSAGADRIAAYVAVAFTGRDLDGGRTCTARPARTCLIAGLTGGKRYTVLVAAVSHGGVSFSALAHGTPQAAGAGGGLPITGPGPLAAAGVALITVGAALLRASRSIGCRHRIRGLMLRGPGDDDATAR
jgi:alpha-tubulin suppressor-like RCC1 family protein